MRYLWGGVAAGVGLALALAAVMLGIAPHAVRRQGLEYFQLAMMLVAAGLIVQMVFWMRRHGRTFKRDLEQDMQRECDGGQLVGPARRRRARRRPRERRDRRVSLRPRRAERERLDLPRHRGRWASRAAFATFWALQQGGKVLSWRTFFRVSEILLLLLAGALLVSAVDKLIALDVLPALVDPVWDTLGAARRLGPRRRPASRR